MWEHFRPGKRMSECAPEPGEFFHPTLVHYENGPETTRTVERDGRLWAVTYHAKKAGSGWRVFDVKIAPVEDAANSLREGDIVEVRCKIVQDMGTDVEI